MRLLPRPPVSSSSSAAARRGAAVPLLGYLPAWIVWTIALMGLVANVAQWSQKYGQIAKGGNDFLDLYAGGKLAADPGLYDPARVAQVQWAAAGISGPAFLFSRPPAFAALLAPLALLPYRSAYFLFQALSLLALVLAVFLWPAGGHRAAVAFACCWSVPLSAAFANGQDVPFLLLWLSIVARLMDRRPGLAGMVAALCMAKLHLFLLVPLWIVSQKRWRLGAGLAGGLLACAAASFALQGPDWIQRYVHLVRNPIQNTDEAAMPNLHGLCSSFGLPLGVELAMCGVVAWVVWRVCHRTPRERLGGNAGGLPARQPARLHAGLSDPAASLGAYAVRAGDGAAATRPGRDPVAAGPVYAGGGPVSRRGRRTAGNAGLGGDVCGEAASPGHGRDRVGMKAGAAAQAE